jgi:hypothetical protein
VMQNSRDEGWGLTNLKNSIFFFCKLKYIT